MIDWLRMSSTSKLDSFCAVGSISKVPISNKEIVVLANSLTKAGLNAGKSFPAVANGSLVSDDPDIKSTEEENNFVFLNSWV